MPADASEAEVWIEEGSEEEQHYLLSLGGLAPPEDTSGLQQRLDDATKAKLLELHGS